LPRAYNQSTSCSVCGGKHGGTAGVASLMVQGPPPDMPGYWPDPAPKVRCQKHNCRVRWEQGMLYCRKGHFVDEDGYPINGNEDDLGDDRW
jgi:hypothetical protein